MLIKRSAKLTRNLYLRLDRVTTKS